MIPKNRKIDTENNIYILEREREREITMDRRNKINYYHDNVSKLIN